MARRWMGFALVAVVAAHFAAAAWLPPADDELYYWCWSRDLQFSYYDHPPLSAYLIRLSTAVFGNSLFGIRFFACVGSLIALLITARLTRSRFLIGCIVLTPVFAFGGVLLTPDAPLLVFWAAYAAWLADAHRRLTPTPDDPLGPRPPRWLLGGILLGLGILGKYTMGLAIPAALLSFLGVRPWRSWLLGFVWHGAVAFAVASPILIHNIRLDFAPLRYQWGHVVVSNDPWSPLYLPEFVGVQVAFVGWLPFVLLPWVLRHRRRFRADPTLRACFWLYVFPLVFFLYKAARVPLEANWPIVCYVSFWPLLRAWVASRRSPTAGRRWVLASFALPAVVTLGLTVHLWRPLPLVPPRYDRATRFAANDKTFRRLSEAVRALHDPSPVFAASYQWTAYLRYHGVPAEQVPGLTRPSQFTTHRVAFGGHERALVVGDGFLPLAVTEEYGPPEILGIFPLRVRGHDSTYYFVIRYTRRPAPPSGLGTTPG